MKETTTEFHADQESLAAMVRELARDAVAYVRDLATLFTTELGEKASALRTSAVLGAAAGLFLLVSFVFLTWALAGAISYGLGGSWRWAFLIVGVGYGIIGSLLMIPVSHALRRGLFKFEHTQRRVVEDTQAIKQKLAA